MSELTGMPKVYNRGDIDCPNWSFLYDKCTLGKRSCHGCNNSPYLQLVQVRPPMSSGPINEEVADDFVWPPEIHSTDDWKTSFRKCPIGRGDTVKIMHRLPSGREHGSPEVFYWPNGWVDEMDKYVRMTARVTEEHNNCLSLDIDQGEFGWPHFVLKRIR